ncbi:MAG: Na/Pi cotransporter family protein [Clostridia bacterium]|nr:Na/Pi cotransporter family protein [Clostridia bacterium]
MDFTHILSLLGGVALFLYGMSAMGTGLKKVAGPKMESYLWKLSSTPLKGFLLGTLVAAVIQSSSATSVMVVSFVNAGMMQLGQAVCIILGSNVGTTMTGWILTLSDSGGNGGFAQIFSTATLIAVFALAGIIMNLFMKKNTVKNFGMILLGLSVLLLSMTLISDSVEPLKESESFRNILLLFSNPVLGILAGAFVAAVVQSSSAGVGILQALCVTGALPLNVCLPLILGINIGASVPVLFSMMGSSKNGKRAALTYLISNVLGLVIVYVLYVPFTMIVGNELLNVASTKFSIAVMNTVLKIVITVVQLPLYKLLVKMAYWFVKVTPDENEDIDEINSLSESLLDYTPIALEKASIAAQKMAEIASKNVKRAMSIIWEYNGDKFNKVQEKEALADKYEDKIGNFVVKIGKHSLKLNEQAKVSELLSSVGDFERLSDHAVNISEAAQEKHEKNIYFSDSAKDEMDLLLNATTEILDLSMQTFKEQNIENAKRIEAIEEVIDEMCKRMRTFHIERVQKGNCTIEMGFVFNDLLVNMERVADHCSNIAFCVLHSDNVNAEGHEFAESVVTTETFRDYFEQYRIKYLLPLEEIHKV